MTTAAPADHPWGASSVTDSGADGRLGPIPARLATTTSMTLFGSLYWLGPLWALAFVANAIVLAAVSRGSSLDSSLWAEIGAGWQRWPIGAAGFTMTAVFVPMFVANGVTRARLGQSAAVTLVGLAVLGAAVVVAGFALEAVVFDAEGWRHVLSEDAGRTAADVGYPTIFVSFALVHAAYFAGGWLAATGLHRLGWVLFFPFLVVALVPAVVTEFLVTNTFGATQFDFLDRFDTPSLWVGIPISIGVIATTTLVAARWTRSVTVE